MKTALVAGASLMALAVISLSAIRFGVAGIDWRTIGAVVLSETGLHPAADVDVSAVERVIVWHLRLPRLIAGMLVGAYLAVAGALLQGLLRNPLASPDILGVSSGAALGAVTAITLGWGVLSIWSVPLCAFGGALVTVVLIDRLAATTLGASTTVLVLCGVALTSVLGALTSFVLTFGIEQYEIGQQIVFWLMGGLTNRGWEHVLMVVWLVPLCGLAMLAFQRDLNLFAVGEEEATSLGVEVPTVKRAVLVTAAALTGAAVSVAGVIAFIGLVVPHIVRLVVGPDHRVVLPLSALGGALLLVGIDLLSRLIIPQREVHLGILISGLGGPFFLYLVLAQHRKGGAYGA